MDCKFKVEIMLDEERVIADGLFDLEEMYQVIIDRFTGYGIPQLAYEDERMLVFGTEEHDMYAYMWQVMLDIEESMIMPYVIHYMWYDLEAGEIENIIEEIEEEYQSRNQGHDLKHVAEIIIDTEKVLRDHAFDLKNMQRTIIDIFKTNDIPKLKITKKGKLTFGTKEHNDFGKLMRSIHRVCYSEMHPYLKNVIWHNFETDSNEDVLETFKRKGWI